MFGTALFRKVLSIMSKPGQVKTNKQNLNHSAVVAHDVVCQLCDRQSCGRICKVEGLYDVMVISVRMDELYIYYLH